MLQAMSTTGDETDKKCDRLNGPIQSSTSS